jgi:hypothetical protein
MEREMGILPPHTVGRANLLVANGDGGVRERVDAEATILTAPGHANGASVSLVLSCTHTD